MVRRAQAPATERRTSPRRAKMMIEADGEAAAEFGTASHYCFMTGSLDYPEASGEAKAYAAAASLLASEPIRPSLHRTISTTSSQAASYNGAGYQTGHGVAHASPYSSWSQSQADSFDTESLFNGSNGSAASSENLMFRAATETERGKVSHARKREAGHIPRPRNAFILFRSHAVKNNIIPKTVEKDHRNISRIVSHMWKSLEPYERSVWEAEAAKEKEEHKRLHPDYRYQPVFHREKVIRRNLKQEPDAEETCEIIADQILKSHGREGVVKGSPSSGPGPKRTAKSITARSSRASGTPRSRARPPSSTRSSSVESLAQSLGRPFTGHGTIGDSNNNEAGRFDASSATGHGNEECVETVLDTPGAGARFSAWSSTGVKGGSEGRSSRATSQTPGGISSSCSTNRKIPAPLNFDAMANSSFMDEPSPIEATHEAAAAAAAAAALTMEQHSNALDGYLFREHMELMEQLQGHPDGPDAGAPPISRPLSAQAGATPHATSFRAAAAAGIHWTGGDAAPIVSPQRAMFGDGRSGYGAAWHSWSRLAAADVSLPVLRPRNSVSGPSWDPTRRMSQSGAVEGAPGAFASSAPTTDGPNFWGAGDASYPVAWEGEWEEMANLDPPSTARGSSNSNVFAWSVSDFHNAGSRGSYAESADSSAGAPSSYAASIRPPTASDASFMPHSEEVEMLDDRARPLGGDEARRRSIVGIKMALSAAAQQNVQTHRGSESDAEAMRDMSMQLLRKWRESFSLGSGTSAAPSSAASSQHSEGHILTASAPTSSFPTPDPDVVGSFISSLEAARLGPSPQPLGPSPQPHHAPPSGTLSGSGSSEHAPPPLFLDGEHPFAARSVSPKGTARSTQDGPQASGADSTNAPLPWAFGTDESKVGHPVDLGLLDAAFAELLDEPLFRATSQTWSELHALL